LVSERFNKGYGCLTCARNRRLTFTAQFGKVALHITRSRRQAPPPQPARRNVIDIVAALQESLAQKKPRKRDAA
jgi:hypothetical protein